MKSILAVFLILAALSLSACGKSSKNTYPCSSCGAEVESTAYSCPKCGKLSSSMKPDGYAEDEEFVRTKELAGVWLLDEGKYGNLISFEFGGVGTSIEIYYPEGVVEDAANFSFQLPEESKLILDGRDEYTYEINDNTLTLSSEDDSYVMNLSRFSDSQSTTSLTGSWQCLFPREGMLLKLDSAREIIRDVQGFDFFNDGSYTIYIDPLVYDNSNEVYGTYGTAHDGTTIVFDGREYYDFSLLGNGLMVFTNHLENTYLFVKSN